MGCNLSGNPLLSARELSRFDLGQNTLILIGCDENELAKGATCLESLFRKCLLIAIGKEAGLEPKIQQLPALLPSVQYELNQ